MIFTYLLATYRPVASCYSGRYGCAAVITPINALEYDLVYHSFIYLSRVEFIIYGYPYPTLQPPNVSLILTIGLS